MKKYHFNLIFFLFIINFGISNAQDISLSTEKNNAVFVFEGHYKVGNTTCIVAPIKMAYEVKWSKGKGSMIFFFDEATSDGKNIFISEQRGKGRDKFIFNDDHYSVGIFIRADGKVFDVERLTR
jgi:hypothetical protein